MSGINWIDSLKEPSLPKVPGREPVVVKEAEARILPSVSSPPPSGKAEMFMLRGGKWVESNSVLTSTLRAIRSGPFLIKITMEEEVLYFCGNDDVYLKLPDSKKKFWIHDIIQVLSEHIPVCPEFWEFKLEWALMLMQAHKVFGGKFDLVPF